MPTGVFERTAEARRNISKAQKGKKLSAEHKKKLSIKMKERIFSEEHRKNLSISAKNREKRTGNKAYAWKGGKRKSRGYIRILKPDHPFCDCINCVLEHRLVMEKHIGRYLLPEEVVHHRNEIKDDNRIENLKLFINDIEHRKYHRLMKSSKYTQS